MVSGVLPLSLPARRPMLCPERRSRSRKSTKMEVSRVSGSKFDESNIAWRQLEGFDELWFYVYGVDRKSGIVDVIFKFAANSRAQLHQHKVPYVTLVLQGELRFYRPNGKVKEVRPVGSYVAGIANGEPHLEGGGDEDAIVFFSFRNADDVLFVFLDESLEPQLPLGINDFEEQLKAQGPAKWQNAA
jgi:hypothetical protein